VNPSRPAWDSDAIARAHALYTELTGQHLSLHLERQRQWALILAQGHGPQDVSRLIRYLQREIRAGRRNVGCLKLSNLLQLDRFEEDLALTQLQLRPPPQAPKPSPTQAPPVCIDEAEDRAARARALEILRDFRRSLR
jgi:hypothetical protein